MNRKLCFGLLIAFGLTQLAALAGTKEEMMRLQNDILTLQNQIREFEKTFGEKLDGLKSLVVQLQDEVAGSGITMKQVVGVLDKQSTGTRSTDQAVLQEIRALSTKMDESATRISALAQQVNELRVQYKALEQQESAAARQSPDDLYNQAMRDFVQENFDLSIQGFSDYANNYPGGEKAASALYYIGEIYRRQKQLTQAAAAFTRVINEYPGTGSVAGALFTRALTALDLQDKDKAIIDFKAVVEKYPDTSEAAQAKTELQRIDVKPAPKPAKKAPARRTR